MIECRCIMLEMSVVKIRSNFSVGTHIYIHIYIYMCIQCMYIFISVYVCV